MKTLKKIHLKNVSEFLSDNEMKQVVGGETLPEVTIYGYGTPCDGGLTYGSCQGTESRSGDTCDYIRYGWHWTGTCKGGDDTLQNGYLAGWPLTTKEHPLICEGTSSHKC